MASWFFPCEEEEELFVEGDAFIVNWRCGGLFSIPYLFYVTTRACLFMILVNVYCTIPYNS